MTRARDLGDFIADGGAPELVVDTTTLVVDSTNNRVGIGTASPATALDVVGNATITTADNTAQLTLVSTDADANAGPILKLRRNSASPADNDLIGAIDWTSENSDGSEHDFLNLTARMRDVTAGSEDVAYAWTAYLNGTGREIQSFVNTDASVASMVFNEDSQDIDFRVESNNNTHMLFVEGGTDRVAIGHSSPNAKLDIMGQGSSATNLSMLIGADEGGTANPSRSDATDKALRIGMPHRTNAEEAAAVIVASSTSSDNTVIIGGGTSVMNAATNVRFYTGANATTTTGTERFRFGPAGQLGIGGATYGTSGQVLTSGGSGAAPTWADAGGGLSGLNYQVFTSSGTYTPTSGYNYAVVYVTGAGGGGGYSNTDVYGGGGAGSGATAVKVYDLSSITTATVTIGSGGAPTTGIGDQGGQSSFTVGGTALSANGGLGGEKSFGVGGQGSRTTANQDFTINGNAGMGGSTGGARSTGGNGGASFWGGGGQGKVYANGQNGINGGGGGGGGTIAGQTRNGGTGGDGIVVVVEYK